MSEEKNPLVYAVSNEDLDDFLGGYLNAAFSNGKLRLEYLKFWHQHSEGEISTSLCAAEEAEFTEILLAASEGNALAALDGLLFCERNGIAPPVFLLECICAIFGAALRGESLGKRGRGNNPIAKARGQALNHWRVSTVKKIVSTQEQIKNFGWTLDPDDILFQVSLPAETIDLLKREKLSDIGSTVNDALEVATISLRGTPAQCSEDWLAKVYYEKSNTKIDKYQPSEELMNFLFIEHAPLAWPFSFGPKERLQNLDDILDDLVPEPK
ncbi:hypothetical protein [Lutimaribacter saemankumensis]|uniref:Uncharacterized protein n=1 Tax=Lutimaribacter saemankumensis TaxID=490829 RepID=A0A1G8RDQ8_9RHOB|nr:hypothetical protein [Lutimaribacter saemankumensis]SDJ15194.1 hypothetical protein SAMN05421850_10980 [Lutimaribacter saemankumensis]